MHQTDTRKTGLGATWCLLLTVVGCSGASVETTAQQTPAPVETSPSESVDEPAAAVTARGWFAPSEDCTFFIVEEGPEGFEGGVVRIDSSVESLWQQAALEPIARQLQDNAWRTWLRHGHELEFEVLVSGRLTGETSACGPSYDGPNPIFQIEQILGLFELGTGAEVVDAVRLLEGDAENDSELARTVANAGAAALEGSPIKTTIVVDCPSDVLPIECPPQWAMRHPDDPAMVTLVALEYADPAWAPDQADALRILLSERGIEDIDALPQLEANQLRMEAYTRYALEERVYEGFFTGEIRISAKRWFALSLMPVFRATAAL